MIVLYCGKAITYRQHVERSCSISENQRDWDIVIVMVICDLSNHNDF